MAFQPVPDVAAVEVRFTLPGNAPAEWRFNCRRSGGYTQAQLDALTAAVDAWVDLLVLPELNNTFTYKETYAKGQEFNPDLESIDNTSTGVGAISSGSATNETALAIKLSTGFAGRSARGRVFLMPPNVADFLTSNTATTTYISDWIAIIEALVSILQGIGWALVVVQRWSEGVKLDEGIARTVTAVSVTDNIFDSQRGRKPKP